MHLSPRLLASRPLALLLPVGSSHLSNTARPLRAHVAAPLSCPPRNTNPAAHDVLARDGQPGSHLSHPTPPLPDWGNVAVKAPQGARGGEHPAGAQAPARRPPVLQVSAKPPPPRPTDAPAQAPGPARPPRQRLCRAPNASYEKGDMLHVQMEYVDGNDLGDVIKEQVGALQPAPRRRHC